MKSAILAVAAALAGTSLAGPIPQGGVYLPPTPSLPSTDVPTPSLSGVPTPDLQHGLPTTTPDISSPSSGLPTLPTPTLAASAPSLTNIPTAGSYVSPLPSPPSLPQRRELPVEVPTTVPKVPADLKAPAHSLGKIGTPADAASPKVASVDSDSALAGVSQPENLPVKASLGN